MASSSLLNQLLVVLSTSSCLAFAPQPRAMSRRIHSSGCSSFDAQPLAAMHPASRRSPSLCAPRVKLVVCSDVRTPSVAIEYCTRCNWMLRSAWLSQELLTTFNGTVAEVRLLPNHEGGVFEVTVDTAEQGTVSVWSRKSEGRFPEAKELKQRVRDVIAPSRALGHSDVATEEEEEVVVTGTARIAFARLIALLQGDRGRRSKTPQK